MAQAVIAAAVVAAIAVGNTFAATGSSTAASSAAPTAAACFARRPFLTGRVVASGGDPLAEATLAKAVASLRLAADAIFVADAFVAGNGTFVADDGGFIADDMVVAAVAAFPRRWGRSHGRRLRGSGLEAEIGCQVGPSRWRLRGTALRLAGLSRLPARKRLAWFGGLRGRFRRSAHAERISQRGPGVDVVGVLHRVRSRRNPSKHINRAREMAGRRPAAAVPERFWRPAGRFKASSRRPRAT